MYDHSKVNLFHPPIERSLKHKYTFNTYIDKVYSQDSRFVNVHQRVNQIDQSKKIIHIKPKGKIQFRIKKQLNHLLNYSIDKKYSYETNPIRVYLNNKLITSSQVYSEKFDNLLKFENTENYPIRIDNPYLIPSKPKKYPNVIFIVIDSLRADVLGCNGSNYNVSPNLDKFAKSAYVFQKHFVNSSWTRPSTMVFFTGMYASRTFINFWDYPVFPEERESFYLSDIIPLPAYLGSLGYKSVMVGNNPFLTDHRYLGVDTGFESVYDFAPVTNDTPKITKKAMEVIERYRVVHEHLYSYNRPLFLFLNYNDPHRPYTPPLEYLDKVKADDLMELKKKNYLGEVAYVDSELGNFFQFLKDKNMFHNSLILVTSDHGEVMNLAHAKSKFTGVYTLYGHGQGLYDEDIHTPLLVKYPFQKEGKVIKRTSRSIDIMPTILDVLNENTNVHKMDGKSLQTLITNKEDKERIYYGEGRGVKGFRTPNYKFMKKTFEFHRPGVSWNGIVGEEPSYLFDLQNDPKEENSIQNKKLTNYFQKMLKKFQEHPSYFGMRVYNPNSQEQKTITLTAYSKVGTVVPTDVKGFRIENAKGLTQYSDGFVLEKKVSSGQKFQFYFSVYPDVAFPKIFVQVDGNLIKREQFGVGQFDIYPGDCSTSNDDCKQMYLAKYRSPITPKNFRVQIWKSGTKQEYRKNNVLLEQEAIDILKKQGYIQ